MSSISAKDAVPGQRLSLDPDGNGRVVGKASPTGSKWVTIYWADGSRSVLAKSFTLYLITPEAA